MRRFIASLPGKVFSQLVILALLLPTLTLALITRATAQVAQLPTWAVIEFTNRKSAGTTFGKSAAASVITELAKTGRYELVPPEQIQRAIEAIGVETPVKGQTNLLRLGQEVRATTLVSGDIVDYRVVNTAAGKQGQVAMLVVLYDVSSGLPVNGVAVRGESSERGSNTSDDVLITDAITQASNTAIRELQARTLPTATVQNTSSDRAFINQGGRSGFKPGQSVIVNRGRLQVATARVTEVEPDTATIKIERGEVGIQPGDKVRAIFDIPDIKGLSDNGGIRKNSKPSLGNPSGLLTVLIVLGIVALLLSSGNSGGQNAAENVVNEAVNDPAVLGATGSGVRISWSGNGFTNGQQQRFQWLIRRSDITDVPVLTVGPDAREAYNMSTQAATPFSYLDRGVAGGVDCNPSQTNRTTTTVPVTTGRPYTYSVELVYRVLNLDLPDGGNTTANTGNTGGGVNNNTGNNTNGNTTSTTGTTTATGATNGNTTNTGTNGTTGATTSAGQGYTYCYFVSGRQSASGPATPLQRPNLTSPAANAELSGDQSFQFGTVGSTDFPTAIEYVLEFSTTIEFLPGTWAQVGKQIISQPLAPNSARTFPSIAVSGTRLPGNLQGATTLYWRVGARSVIDRPGPQRSKNGQRYVYSFPPSNFRPASTPPPTP